MYMNHTAPENPPSLPSENNAVVPPVRPRWSARTEYAIVAAIIVGLSLLFLWRVNNPIWAILFWPLFMIEEELLMSLYGMDALEIYGLDGLGMNVPTLMRFLGALCYFSVLFMPCFLTIRSSRRTWKFFWGFVSILFLAAHLSFFWVYFRFFFRLVPWD